MGRKRTRTIEELKADRDSRAAKGLCRVCDEEAKCRGLCWRDYRVFYRKVQAGELEEQKAVSEGLVSPSSYARGKSGFEKALGA